MTRKELPTEQSHQRNNRRTAPAHEGNHHQNEPTQRLEPLTEPPAQQKEALIDHTRSAKINPNFHPKFSAPKVLKPTTKSTINQNIITKIYYLQSPTMSNDGLGLITKSNL